MTTEQSGLFDDTPARVEHDTQHVRHLPARIGAMHRVYGRGPVNATCRTCAHLYSKRYGETYYKCDLNADTNGPGTDWRVSWPACGKYESEDAA